MRSLKALGTSKEREYFIDNLAMLIASGMDVLLALESVKTGMRSSYMQGIAGEIMQEVDAGSPLWQALENTRLFAPHIISLVRVGEKTGRLGQNLKTIIAQEQKERVFRSKIRSAMMYPLFVLSLTFIIGVGTIWFLLPRLSLVFSQLRIQLPFITQVLIRAGKFFAAYGIIAVPLLIGVVVLALFLLFVFPKTKAAGEYILLWMPGVSKLIKEVEVSRMGYLLGNLLGVGLPIIESLDSLSTVSTYRPYQNLYLYLRQSIEEGNSFQKSFALYPGSQLLVPFPIQQLIAAAEQSGELSKTLITIGETYEEKTDTTTKNLTVILEPILLVVVWAGVMVVALAVILPVYRLIGGLDQDQAISPPTPSLLPPETLEGITAATSTSESLEDEAKVQPEPEPELEQETLSHQLEILPTELGYLNVRDKPSRSGKVIDRVNPGETYEYLTQEGDWYEIMLPDTKIGWINKTYVKEKTNIE